MRHWKFRLGVMLAVAMGITALAADPAVAVDGPARLVKDLNTASVFGNGDPARLVAAQGGVFFTAFQPDTGFELWKSDGTEGGTRLVKDVVPGAIGSSPEGFVALGRRVFFTIDDRVHGVELWTSDGTDAGTSLVKDIRPGAEGSGPSFLTADGGVVYFRADDGIHGAELWRTDGTSEGTALVKDMAPGSASSSPYDLAAYRGLLYFASLTPDGSSAIWRTDGTPDGTTLVESFPAGPGLSFPFELTVAGDTLFFASYNGGISNSRIWKSDGTPLGTSPVFDLAGYPVQLHSFNSLLIFIGVTAAGQELWRSDGTAQGTFLLKDIGPGYSPGAYLAAGTSPVVGSSFFFVADDGVHGSELWKTDGTTDGTVLVKDIRPGPDSGIATGGYFTFAVEGGHVYFRAGDGILGEELWRSDGTETGTTPVADLQPGPAGSGPDYMTPFGGGVMFSADDGRHGRELWWSDGTATGTRLVKDIEPFVGTAGSGPFGMVAMGRSVLFADSGDPSQGFHPGSLWKSDGTEAGTALIKDVTALFQTMETKVGGTLFFPGNDGEHGIELWKTDATEAGTTLVKDIQPGPGRRNAPVSGVALGESLFFVPFDPDHGREPWISDGTEGGTHLLKDIVPGTESSIPFPVASDGTIAYFGVGANNGGPPFHHPLWKSDGTENGTVLVKEVDVASGGETQSANFVMSGRALFFLGDDGTHGAELWKSDGTEAGTVLIKDLTPGADSTVAERFTDVGGILFFFRYAPDGKAQLWKSDGTGNGTVSVRDLGHGVVLEAIAAGQGLFFISLRDTGQVDLWRSDGTEAGTRIVKENDVDLGDDLRRHRLGAVGGVVLFSASDGASGYELWRSDGTDSGTFLVQEIAPGADSSHPHGFAVAGSWIFLAADDIVHGDELWSGRAAIVTRQPRRAVQDLSDEVRDLKLPGGTETSLLAKLDAAAQAMGRGENRSAVGSLGAFMKELNAQRGKKVPAEAADDLTQFAGEILGLVCGDGARP